MPGWAGVGERNGIGWRERCLGILLGGGRFCHAEWHLCVDWSLYIYDIVNVAGYNPCAGAVSVRTQAGVPGRPVVAPWSVTFTRWQALLLVMSGASRSAGTIVCWEQLPFVFLKQFADRKTICRLFVFDFDDWFACYYVRDKQEVLSTGEREVQCRWLTHFGTRQTIC